MFGLDLPIDYYEISIILLIIQLLLEEFLKSSFIIIFYYHILFWNLILRIAGEKS